MQYAWDSVGRLLKPRHARRSTELLRERIEAVSIVRESDRRIYSRRGGINSWLLDLRPVLLDPECLDLICDLFWAARCYGAPVQIGGLETSAIPLITALVLSGHRRGVDARGFVVRKERKSYGVGNCIEGSVERVHTIVVDDIFHSGRSFKKVVAALNDEGVEVNEAFHVVNYGDVAGNRVLTESGIGVQCLLPLSALGLDLSCGPSAVVRPELFEVVWSKKSEDPNYYSLVPKSFPAVDERNVYYGSDCGLFRARDQVSGELRWRMRVKTRGNKNIWSSPAVHDGKVFFGGYDGNFYCLEAATGREVWRVVAADWIGSSPCIAADLGLVFIGLEFAVEGRRGAVAAYDMATGTEIWACPTRRYTHASPAYSIERGVVACGSNDDELLLFEARSGRRLWRFQTRGGEGRKGSIRHAAAFYDHGRQIVTGSADGYIYVVDTLTGEEVWSVKTGDSVYTVPLVVGNHAFVGSSDKCFYILDLARRELAEKLEGDGRIFCPPSYIGGNVYFGTSDGSVCRLDPLTLEVDAKSFLPDAITNRICYSSSSDLFFILSYTNQLFATRLVNQR